MRIWRGRVNAGQRENATLGWRFRKDRHDPRRHQGCDDHRDEGRRQGDDGDAPPRLRRRSRTATSRRAPAARPTTTTRWSPTCSRRWSSSAANRPTSTARTAARIAPRPRKREIAVIERFLPAQLSDAEAEAKIREIVAETGASSMKDMGRVMALVKERLGARSSRRALRRWSRPRSPSARKRAPPRVRRSPGGNAFESLGGGGFRNRRAARQARHAVHGEMIQADGDRCRERRRPSPLEVERDSVELGADGRDVSQRSADDRQGNDQRDVNSTRSLGIARPAIRPSTTSTNGTSIMLRAMNPATIARRMAERGQARRSS